MKAINKSPVMAYPNPINEIAPTPQARSAWMELKEQALLAFESGLLPRSIDTRQKAVTIALMGREFDLNPMQALCGIYVVNGMVALRGSLMLRLIYERVPGARITVLTPPEKADTECTVEMQRPNNEPQKFRSTLEDARRAGFGNKPIWQQHPATMLRCAAIRTGARIIFADAIAGCYMEDELPAEQAAAMAAERERAAAASAPASAPVVASATPTEIVIEEPRPRSIDSRPPTEKQLHRLFAIAHSKNRTRNEVLAALQTQFGKYDVHKLTRAEYDTFCNALLAESAREVESAE
jgi:hypothetical protein